MFKSANASFKQAVILGVVAASSCGPASGQAPTKPILLWQNLEKGMSPETVAQIVSKMEVVKAVKVVAPSKAAPAKRLQIKFQQKINIASVPFELEPVFAEDKLVRVLLNSPAQCAQGAVEKFNALAQGLNQKYGNLSFGKLVIDDGDLASAQLKSFQTNTKSQINSMFRSPEIVAVLRLNVWTERTPAFPSLGGSFAYNMWKLSKVQYDNRKSECNGTGHQRVDIRIGYVAAADFDQSVQTKTEESEQKAEDTKSQL